MFSALVDTSLTEAKYWSYIAEGGASIVVRYMGVANSTFTGHVLRLRKRPISPATSSKAAEDVEQKSLRFQADVIAKLLPPDAVPVLHLALVEQAWLEELAIHIESARPPTRRAVDCIDIDRPYAILAPNLISDTGVSIEIKPKWGFLPNPVYLSPASRLIKTQTCRFCMHAHFRMTKGERKTATEYCPLDLYSCEYTRVRHALKTLWDDWVATGGDENNLRVFLDGKVVRPSEISSMKHLSTQLISLGAMAGPSDLRNAFTDRCALILLTSPVLPTLSHLQRYFDELDIEGLETVLSSYSSRQGTSDLTSLLQPGSEDEWAAFATSHADRVGVAPQDMASISSSDTRQCVLATLLSGTFKDCSLLVSLPDKTVSVADTEPKPPRKLLEWAELDSHIVRTYADVPAAQRRRCKDANRPPHQQESDSDGQKSDASRSVRTSETFPFLMGLTAMIIATSWALPMLGR